MEKQMNQTEIDNEKILSLIKNKYRPLKQHKQDILLPYIKAFSMHVSPSKINHNQPKLQHEEVSMKKRKKKKRESNYWLPEVGLMQGKQQNVHPLVKKVNKYLENIRKNERDQNEKQISPVYTQNQQNSVRLNHIKQLSELRKYLGILQQPRHQHQTKTKDKDDIFNRSQTYFITEVEDERRKSIGEGYSRESSMLINAKIRRKFNHKKMLALYRF